MERVCVRCGERFELRAGKPGLATECMECTTLSASLLVRNEVQVYVHKEMAKSAHRFKDGLPRQLRKR